MWKDSWWTDFQKQARLKRERLERQKKETLEEQRERRREERESQTLQINRGLLYANVGLFAFAALASGAAIWQAWESRRAAKDAQNNFVITRQDAKDSAAQARQDALDAIKQQLDAQHELRDQAARSAKAAEVSSAVAAESFHVSERAYVYLTTPVLSPLAAGQHARVAVQFGNSGRTPALSVSLRSYMARVPASVPVGTARAVVLASRPDPDRDSTMTIPANSKSEQDIESSDALSQAEVDSIREGKTVFRVFSAVTYKDIFGRMHHEELCTALDRTLAAMEVCNKFNRSD